MGRTGLSGKELNRVEVLGRVRSGELKLGEASELMEVSYRQAKRIWKVFESRGAEGLQHGNCGRGSNRAYKAEFRAQVMKRVGSGTRTSERRLRASIWPRRMG